MSENEIVETRGQYRAVISLDQGPSAPDGDFFGTVYSGWRGRFERVGAPYRSPDDFSDTLRFAWEHYRDMALVQRYLRMFHDVRGFDYFDTSDGWYVNVVTDYDLKLWGWSEDPAEWPKHDDGTTYRPEENNLDEWQHYHDGEVYFVGVQKCVTWHADDDDYPDEDRWEDVNETQVGGYYGEEWATLAATEALDDFVPRPCKVCGQPMEYDRSKPAPQPWKHVTDDASHVAVSKKEGAA